MTASDRPIPRPEDQEPGHRGPAGVPAEADPRPVRRAPPPPSLVEATGGPLGIAESAVPAAVFVIGYTATGHDTTVAAVIAVAVAAVLAVLRLVRGQTVQFALFGLAGIALAAFVAAKSGKAENFFLPGLLINAAYAGAYLVSIVVRWPIIGVVTALVTQQDSSWRRDPVQLRAYRRASWLWVVLFSARIAVQAPMYAAGALVALGVARVAMGIPLFVLGLWLTWLLVRDTALAQAQAPPADPAPADAP